MSFKLIAKTHGKVDPDLGERAHRLGLLLSLLDGTFYDKLTYDFTQAWDGDRFVYMIERKPNVPTGTNELRVQTERHAAMLFGDDQFPEIETKDSNARLIFKKLIEETQLPERMQEAAFIGSTGSVAIHMRALGPSDTVRIFFDVYSTRFLTPTFDKDDPTALIGMKELYKLTGKDLRGQGYVIDEEDDNEQFFFQRTWDTTQEVWYIPWKVSAAKAARETGKSFVPSIDDNPDKTTTHNLGFCPWYWAKNIHAGRDIDGACSWWTAVEHAVQLDYQDSQIVAGIKYAMSPTTVIESKTGAPQVSAPGTGTGSEMAKTPETVVETENAKVYLLEMDGKGFEQAREKSKELRTSALRAMHGSVIDPKEIAQAHQGAKTMAMIDAAVLGHVGRLRQPYGRTLLGLVQMVQKVVLKRKVLVNGEIVPAAIGAVTDLSLRWGDIFPITPAEKLADAQADDYRIKNGSVSRKTAILAVAADYHIDDVDEEMRQISKEMDEADAREIAKMPPPKDPKPDPTDDPTD